MKVARKGLKVVFVGKRLLTWSKLYFTDEKRDEANTGISGSLDKKSDKVASFGEPTPDVFTGHSGLPSLPHHWMRLMQS